MPRNTTNETPSLDCGRASSDGDPLTWTGQLEVIVDPYDPPSERDFRVGFRGRDVKRVRDSHCE